MSVNIDQLHGVAPRRFPFRAHGAGRGVPGTTICPAGFSSEGNRGRILPIHRASCKTNCNTRGGAVGVIVRPQGVRSPPCTALYSGGCAPAAAQPIRSSFARRACAPHQSLRRGAGQAPRPVLPLPVQRGLPAAPKPPGEGGRTRCHLPPSAAHAITPFRPHRIAEIVPGTASEPPNPPADGIPGAGHAVKMVHRAPDRAAGARLPSPAGV
jgi:hypothetical protein